MRNTKSVMRQVIGGALILTMILYRCGAEKKDLCRTCTATNSYGNIIETKTVCTSQEEQEFRDHYGAAQTPVAVKCK